MIPKIVSSIEDLFYSRIVKPVIFTSRLGRRSMFGYADSGLNFDHIYGNKAKGYNRFGKAVDRILLNLPACKATRYRKERIIKILDEEIKKNISRGKKTRIVDLASGPARYLVDLMTDDLKNQAEALCLDIDLHSLNYGKKIAGSRPILYKKSNILKIGSHYKRFSINKRWHPNIVIASGFYEYIDDELANAALRLINGFLEPGGLLLLITQRDSPNRKLIEKVGLTKSGKKWVLFYREPELIKQWIREAGYKNIGIEVDPWRMYVFYTARKALL